MQNQPHAILPEDAVTLAERLKANGYENSPEINFGK